MVKEILTHLIIDGAMQEKILIILNTHIKSADGITSEKLWLVCRNSTVGLF